MQEIPQSILEVAQTTPILVRRDGGRFVLVHGLHRFEAYKALGEEWIFGYLVQAPKRYMRKLWQKSRFKRPGHLQSAGGFHSSARPRRAHQSYL